MSKPATELPEAIAAAIIAALAALEDDAPPPPPRRRKQPAAAGRPWRGPRDGDWKSAGG